MSQQDPAERKRQAARGTRDAPHARLPRTKARPCNPECVYRLLFEKSPQPLYVFDGLTLQILAVNEAALRLYGYARQEFLGLMVPDLCPAAEAQRFVQAKPEVRDCGGLPGSWPEGVWRQCRKDGTIIEVEIKASPVAFQGRPAVLALANEITERKQAEEKLRTSHHLLQAVIEGISQAIYVKDLHGRYLMVNSATAQLIGKPAEEVLGQDDTALFAPEMARQFMEADRRIMRRGQSETYEDFATQAGITRAYLTTKAPFRGPGGEVLGVLGTSRDITEQKHAVEALRSTQEFLSRLLETIPAVVDVASRDGCMRLVNRAWEQCFGRSRAQVLGLRKTEVFPAELARRLLASDQQVIKTAAPLVFEELLEIQGRARWFHTVKFPLCDAAGAVDAVGGFSIDITERRLAEQALRAYSDRLQALSGRLVKVQEEERRHWGRELHDEIGQILTAVFYNLQAIKGSCGPAVLPRLAETLDIVDRAIRQVRTLALRLRPALLEDLGLAGALRRYLDELAQRTGLATHLGAAPPGGVLPLEVENHCFRVAQEALTNVVRHAQARQVWLDFQQHDGALYLAIRDDGVGFDVTAALQRAAQGECFGLLGMQQRVEMLGGRIVIVSKPGEGTTVRVWLPLHFRPDGTPGICQGHGDEPPPAVSPGADSGFATPPARERIADVEHPNLAGG